MICNKVANKCGAAGWPSPLTLPTLPERQDRRARKETEGPAPSDRIISSIITFVLVRLTMSKQRNTMHGKPSAILHDDVGKIKGGGWNKFKRERRTVYEAPQFEVAGTHVVILVAAVMALAWFAGLLPDP